MIKTLQENYRSITINIEAKIHNRILANWFQHYIVYIIRCIYYDQGIYSTMIQHKKIYQCNSPHWHKNGLERRKHNYFKWCKNIWQNSIVFNNKNSQQARIRRTLHYKNFNDNPHQRLYSRLKDCQFSLQDEEQSKNVCLHCFYSTYYY